MHRPGSNPNNMQLTDFLCDFCGKPWDGAFPLVEGHQGSLICGSCLTVAYTQLVHHESNAAPTGYKCTLCLEHRDQPAWQSPLREQAVVCLRCVKQSATTLHTDPEWDWSKPPAPARSG